MGNSLAQPRHGKWAPRWTRRRMSGTGRCPEPTRYVQELKFIRALGFVVHTCTNVSNVPGVPCNRFDTVPIHATLLPS